MTELIFGEGTLTELDRALTGFPGDIVVVTGAQSFESSGAAAKVDAALGDRAWRRVSVTDRLPGRDSAAAGLTSLAGFEVGVVIAIGGGTVIDTAKLMSVALANDGIDALFAGGNLRSGPPLIAVPTTAGSGAERTPFAVAYLGEEKHSIGHEAMAPAIAIVDPELTYALPRELTVSSGLDALAHAIESLWSTRATTDSRELSRRALYTAWTNLSAAADEPSRASRNAMADAATTAGAAIAVARTTAAHALSYHLTARYRVPHGAAVAMTIGPLLELNGLADRGSTMHPGGVEAARGVVAEIAGLLGATDGSGARVVWDSKLASLGAPTRLSDIGLTSGQQVDDLLESVNQERLANNPRRLDQEVLRAMLEGIR